jgi:hypothetical protein
MDPNKTLANMRAILAEMNRGITESEFVSLADELYWMIRDLDTWMSHGGYLPTEWNRRNRATAQR